MKILYLFDFFSPHGGGTVDVIYKLSRALADKGHEVVIYTSDYKLDKEYIASLAGVTVRTFHCISSLAHFYFTPGLVRAVRENLKAFNIVHLHCFRSFQNIIVWHYARKYGIPYVLHGHGSLATFFQKGWLKRIFDVIWGHRILKDASKMIAVTQAEAEQYKNMGVSEDKIEIVPNGIDLSEYNNLPQKGMFRTKYSIKDSERVILYLARINKIKGPDLLAKAFAELSKEVDNVKLVIVGPDDGYLPALRKLIANLQISDRVLFTGPLYRKEKLEAYVAAEVYVLPSVYETFPVAVLEALACGTPVVLTDRCGIAETIAQEQVGLVVAYNEHEMQQALLHMLGDDEMRLRFSEKGKLLVREKFDYTQMVEQMEKIYQNTVDGNIFSSN